MHLLAIIVFSVAALLGTRLVIGDIVSGQTSTKYSYIKRSENAGGFWLLVAVKSAFVIFAFALLLNAFGLIGDPYAPLHRAVPSLFR